MAIIKGMSVVLYIKQQIGVDGFNSPIYEEIPETVENILIAPTSPDEIINSQDLHGKKAVYTLAIPKGDTHNWEDATVEFFGRKWKTFGFPVEGIEENMPLSWNKKVMVEAYG